MLETRLVFALVGVLTFAAQISAVIKYPPLMVKQPQANEELLFQVATRVDENDKPFIIECEAEGEPVPRYRWKKNGKPFEWQTYDERMSNQPGRGTLVITKPRDEDMGQYECYATNELGTATSNSVLVRKSVLNSFTYSEPITENIEEGNSASFSCESPDGYPKPLVNWMIQDDRGRIRRINNTRMTVDEEGTLHFSNVTRTDESMYVCSATSHFRNEYKIGNHVFLKVLQKGNISTLIKHEPSRQFLSRKNFKVLKGKEFQLWCVFSGSPLPTIEWSKKDGVIPLERATKENYGKTLVIKYADLEDSGTYECSATNGVGRAKSYTINVEVHAIPYFTVAPELQNKAEGETAVFECDAKGIPPPEIKWIYNGRSIEEAIPNSRRVVETNRITITGLVKNDTGNYGCNATNDYGYAYKDVYINVLALPPEIRVPPKHIGLVDGKEVNMTCETFGAPKPRVSGIRDGLELIGGRYQVKEDGQLAAQNSSVIKYPPLMVKQRPANEELLFQVATRVDEYDKPFIIECEAEGEPAPRYHWKKNGKPFEWQTYDERMSNQPGRGTLVITKPRDEDMGQYECYATNELGTATSNSVLVRKSVLNSFTYSEPITENIEEGNSASFSCESPDGYPKPLVNWMIQDDRGGIRRINNTRMTVDEEGTLHFSNVTRTDESMYVCSATSPFRNEYKIGNHVFLKVLQKGNISTLIKHEPSRQFLSRKNFKVLKGKEFQLWCVFSGSPLPTIEWSKKNGVIPLERATKENYGKTLVIKYADLEDSGTYECSATNGVGRAKSYTINVEVHAIPYFTVAPELQNKAEGETAVFECDAKGIPPPEIKWIYNGRSIEEAIPNSRRVVETNRITITGLVKNDTGNYGCNATNDYGYAYKDVYINVLALPPEIRVPPKHICVVDGKTVNMTCETFGIPKPRVSWIRDGLELTGGRYQVKEDGQLIINQVAFTDAGDYQCIAINRFGNQTAKGSLTVKRRTKLTDKPQDYEVPAGHTATFKCNAVADRDLELNIGWLVNGKEIDFVQEPRFVQQSDFSLSITKTTELDSGQYTCVASTALDSVSASATLLVQDVPNPPKLYSVECHDVDALIKWQPQGDNRAPILGYIIQYNTSFTPDTWENSFDHVPVAKNNNFDVKMSPYANYTFRVIAKNKIGSSAPSNHSEMCTTPPDVPHKNPEGVEGKGSTPRNLVIKWSPMPQIDHNGPGFRYQVYWMKEDVDGAEWQTESVTDWEQDHFIVKDQPTYRPYRIKVEAHNKMGQAHVTAEEIIGYSGEDVPLEAPKNLTRVSIEDATTAVLSWEPVSEDSIRGEFKGYKVQTWTENESEDKARDIIIKNNNEPNARITSFVPYVKNFVRVLVFNGAHDGPPSETISFTMPEGDG